MVNTLALALAVFLVFANTIDSHSAEAPVKILIGHPVSLRVIPLVIAQELTGARRMLSVKLPNTWLKEPNNELASNSR